MRWIVLALSLGTTIVSLIHGAFAIWGLTSGGGTVMVGESPFTWMAAMLLMLSAVLGLIGGILAFNRRRIGGIFILLAAVLCIFAHSSTRVYGYVLLAGCALVFFIRKPYDYGYEEEDDLEDEDEFDAEDEENRDRNVLRANLLKGRREREKFQEISHDGRRKERASRINLDREEYSLGDDGTFKMSEPLRGRRTKVCPFCGASVGIDHKFCYTCGRPLQGARTADSDSAGFSLTPQSDSTAESSPVSTDFQTVSQSVEPASGDEYGWNAENKRDTKMDEGYEAGSGEEDTIEDLSDDAMSHRVFVKPSSEDEAEPAHTFAVSPDNSYQEFSNYTRRRKRKRNSLARRVSGLLILLLAVSGAAWLLLSMSKVDDPVPPPVIEEPVSEQAPEPVVVTPEPTVWEQLRIENPTRGVVTGTNVNVRQDHSTATRVVTRLNAGTRADVSERWDETSGTYSGPWFHIRTSAGADGWIRGDLFKALDGRDVTLPAGYTDALLRSFGAVRPELTSQLGSPTSQTPTTMTWNTGLTADVRADSEITRLQVTGALHVLLNGVAVGITEDTLYRTAGYPSDYNRSSGQLRYVESGSGSAARGMAINLQNGRVQRITVGNI